MDLQESVQVTCPTAGWVRFPSSAFYLFKMNQFIFGDRLSDKLNAKINFREINKIATEWLHPYYPFILLGKEMAASGVSLLEASKKSRESYSVAILAFSLQQDTGKEWWLHIPDVETPDGYIVTYEDETAKNRTVLKGKLREIEVVEHRLDEITLMERLKTKLLDASYNPDTVIVCLLLVAGAHDLEGLSRDLKKISSKLSHVFVVMHGIQASSENTLPDLRLTTIQLLPEYNSITFDLQDQYEDFKKKFNVGQEIRLIEGNEIYFGTRNLKFQKN